jgi:hypothetical protein
MLKSDKRYNKIPIIILTRVCEMLKSDKRYNRAMGADANTSVCVQFGSLFP